MVNYYTILRIREEATTDEIKSAYRALAKQYHPDVNPNNIIAEEYFKQVNEAYSVLSDPIKRNWYSLLVKGNLVFQPTDPRKYGTRHRYTHAEQPETNKNVERDSSTPFWLKQSVLLLTMLWSLLIIFNNWFTTYEGYEMAIMVFSFLLFIVASYFFINNLYNQWRTIGTSFNPESRSLTYFLMLFFFTMPAFFAIGCLRKSIHLKYYANITEARIMENQQKQNEHWVSVIYFDERNEAYQKDFKFAGLESIAKLKYKILIKYSTREPRIMQFKIKLTDKDSVFQEVIDRINSQENYFTDESINN